MGVRRWFARRKRERVREVWPILPGSERPPMVWPGWPDGKQFAFLLTHDVEGPNGLNKVRPLAELEMHLGFRSCFNFIPAGGYSVPVELRHWLVNHGFEVGVHDFKHDGHLFSSRQEFKRCVPRINAQLAEWGAVGFRSGFMIRNLDWLGDLKIQYDCSTFDTDPFEPQPDGTGTIFPFWISSPPLHSGKTLNHAPTSGFRSQNQGVPSRGYVELPYTLAQDSTLFLLLRERTPNIWLRKLDWVSQHGGMAMVNVHPDYIQFDGERPSARTYPVDHFIKLLNYTKTRFVGQFWSGLPREMSVFWKQAVLKVPSDIDSTE